MTRPRWSRRPISDARRALIIGCHGGVGRAVLSLLDRSRRGRQLLERLDSLVLLDQAATRGPMPLARATLLPPAAVRSADDLAQLVAARRITQVIYRLPPAARIALESRPRQFEVDLEAPAACATLDRYTGWKRSTRRAAVQSSIWRTLNGF